MSQPSKGRPGRRGPNGTTRALERAVAARMEGTGEGDILVATAAVADDPAVPLHVRFSAVRHLAAIMFGRWALAAARQGVQLSRDEMLS